MRASSVVVVAMVALLAGCGDAGKGPSSPPNVERSFDMAQIARGQALYAQNCARCHGDKGQGDAQWRKANADGSWPPPPLDGSGHAWHHPTAVLQRVIREGTEPQGHMPAWGGKLNQAEIDDTIAWFQSLWSDEVYQAWWEMEQRSRRMAQSPR